MVEESACRRKKIEELVAATYLGCPGKRREEEWIGDHQAVQGELQRGHRDLNSELIPTDGGSAHLKLAVDAGTVCVERWCCKLLCLFIVCFIRLCCTGCSPFPDLLF